MRQNAFRDFYAHTSDDIDTILDAKAMSPEEVYVAQITAPEEDGGKFEAEILANEDGELIGYVECDTEVEVRTLLTIAGIEIQA